jgi:hypothetical protein
VSGGLGERAENEVALLCAAMPAAEDEPPTPKIEIIVQIIGLGVLGSGGEICHRKGVPFGTARSDNVVA